MNTFCLIIKLIKNPIVNEICKKSTNSTSAIWFGTRSYIIKHKNDCIKKNNPKLNQNKIERLLEEFSVKDVNKVKIKIITCKNASLGEINKIANIVSKFINNETQIEFEIEVDKNFEIFKKNLIVEIIK